MKIVLALGGNALLQRGEPLEASIQRKNINMIAKTIGNLANDHQIIICHGNGPQVGLLALALEAYSKVKPYPLDILDAESQGMVGYLIQQEIGNQISKPVITILTQITVDPNDPAFQHPTNPIGPIYTKEQAEEIKAAHNWHIAPDGQYFRRVVPSPKPIDIIELTTIKTLLDAGSVVICGGGGGIPVIRNPDDHLVGIEAVIDKDNTAALIAEKTNADLLLILTAVDAVYTEFDTLKQRAIKSISSAALEKFNFPLGSMAPKVQACCRFVTNTNKPAVIGHISNLHLLIKGQTGTKITLNENGIAYYD